jgi:hypothetical protein
LENNILAEGDLYAGDLLKSVLDSDEEYWIKNKNLWLIVKNLYTNSNKLSDNDSIFQTAPQKFRKI